MRPTVDPAAPGVAPVEQPPAPALSTPVSAATTLSASAADLVGAERALRDVFADGSVTSASLGFGYRRLWGSLADAADGGKRLRPALFLVAYRAWGGTDARSADGIAAALELLHTAFVVHDDVIDGDHTRRGRFNVSGAHAAEAHAAGVDPQRSTEYGAAAGILAGDLALAAALRAVAFCPVDRPTMLRLFDLFDSALHTTAAGELADVWMSLGVDRPGLPESLSVEERKTGAYSFTLPLQAAAVLAGAPEAAVSSSGDVGRFLGIAFQLADDLLGVFGDPATTGKSTLSDLRAGKQTPLVAHARGTNCWPEIAPFVGRADLTEDQAVQVRLLLEMSGSRRFVEELAGDYARGALACGRDAGLPTELVSFVRALTTDLPGRTS